MTNPQIRLAQAAELIDLRHACLRQGLPREAAIFEGDDEPGTLHAVAEVDSRIIGCATLVQRPWKDQRAWQLRGMAVDPTSHRCGIGRKVLALLETTAASRGYSDQLWCNARLPAAGFYQKNGWEIVSEVFEIPTAGPHVKMTKRLAARCQ